MSKHQGTGFYIILMLTVFTVGIIIGSCYAVGISGETAEEIHSYLSSFFENNTRSATEIFLASFLNNLKLFSVIFIAGFFKFGMPATLGMGCMEGFTSGFTTAALIKLMGWKGFFIGLSSVFSVLIFVLNMIFYGAYSIFFSISEGKRDKFSKKNYMIISLISLTIFCVASLFDGYITTIFMKLVVTKL